MSAQSAGQPADVEGTRGGAAAAAAAAAAARHLPRLPPAALGLAPDLTRLCLRPQESADAASPALSLAELRTACSDSELAAEFANAIRR